MLYENSLFTLVITDKQQRDLSVLTLRIDLYSPINKKNPCKKILDSDIVKNYLGNNYVVAADTSLSGDDDRNWTGHLIILSGSDEIVSQVFEIPVRKRG